MEGRERMSRLRTRSWDVWLWSSWLEVKEETGGESRSRRGEMWRTTGRASPQCVCFCSSTEPKGQQDEEPLDLLKWQHGPGADCLPPRLSSAVHLTKLPSTLQFRFFDQRV